MITCPSPHETIASIKEGNKSIYVKGVAWGGGGSGLNRVDVSIDGGKVFAVFSVVLCCSLLFFAVLCCSFFVGVFWFMFCSMFNWCCLGFHLWHCSLMLCMPCPVHPVLASSSTAGEHFTRAELIEKPIKEHRQSQWSWQFFEKEVPIPEGLKERLDRGEKVHYF